MKDDHLIAALRRALARYGSPELPPDAGDADAHRTRRPARNGASRARAPGWVSIGEIEASQPPNSYPRLGRREIKVRCRELAGAPNSPVAQVRSFGLRTWVQAVAPPHGDDGAVPSASATSDAPATERSSSESRAAEARARDSAGKDVQGPRGGDDGDVDEPATQADDVDLDLPDRS